jgi:hypothetical protein
MKVIKGYGAPDASTMADVNDLYVDLNTNDVYRCTNIETIGEEWGDVTLYARGLDNTVYVWEPTSGGGSARPVLIYNEDDKTTNMTWQEAHELILAGELLDAYVVHSVGDSYSHDVNRCSKVKLHSWDDGMSKQILLCWLEFAVSFSGNMGSSVYANMMAWTEDNRFVNSSDNNKVLDNV